MFLDFLHTIFLKIIKEKMIFLHPRSKPLKKNLKKIRSSKALTDKNTIMKNQKESRRVLRNLQKESFNHNKK
jgi:hypothetical protein